MDSWKASFFVTLIVNLWNCGAQPQLTYGPVDRIATTLPFAQAFVPLSPAGLNVCPSCRSLSCCSGWEKGENDGPSCLTPLCFPPCVNGICTSPNVCTCAAGFIGDTCEQESTRSFDVRLLHGKTANLGIHQGIVQIRPPNADNWGFVDAEYWDQHNSHVVCLQLGYLFASGQSFGTWHSYTFPEANSSILPVHFNCTTDDFSLDDCDVSNVEDAGDEQQIVGLRCDNYDPFTDWLNTCGSSCTQETVTRTGCKCDPLCESYRDCCPDYATNDNCPLSEPTAILTDATCTPMPPFHLPSFALPSNFDVGYFMVSQCSVSWGKDDDISSLCVKDPNPLDPFTFTPVQDEANGDRKVYRNVFCAICNFEPLQYLQAWELMISNSTKGQVTFLDVIPPAGSDLPRTCYLNLEDGSECSFASERITESCKGYYAPISLDNKVFRNRFCTACSFKYSNREFHFDFINLPIVRNVPDCGTIANPDPGPESTKRPSIIPELLSLFDPGERTNPSCKPGEILDHFTRSCRLLSCPQNFRLLNGKCEPLDILREPTLNGRTGYEECIKEAFMEQADQLFQANLTVSGINNVTVHSDYVVVSVNRQIINETVTGFNNIILSWTNNSLESDLFCNVSSLVLSLEKEESNSLSELSCNTQVEIIGCVADGPAIYKDETQSLASFIDYRWSANDTCYKVSIVWKTCSESISPCPEIEIHEDEYEMSVVGNTTTFTIKDTGVKLLNEDINHIVNGTLKVCASHIRQSQSELKQILSYVTFGCFILSLVATFITFVSYCVFKELRNTSGYVIMNFLFAFFIAQLMFLVSPRLIDPYILCLASAIAGQFFWLASFFWMNALSLVTTSTMSRNTLVRNKSMELCILLKYMAYAWSGPLVITGVCVALHFCDCTDIAPIYGLKGGTICWIIGHDGLAVLWGFTAPVAALIVFNIVLFLYAVVTFHKKMASGSRTRTSSKRIKMEIGIYIKLTVLMGLPWLLGFVQTIHPNIILNYVYTILNSLQGVLIFWALVLTGRAGKLWRHKMCSRRKDATRSTGFSADKATMKTVSTSFMTSSLTTSEFTAKK